MIAYVLCHCLSGAAGLDIGKTGTEFDRSFAQSRGAFDSHVSAFEGLATAAHASEKYAGLFSTLDCSVIDAYGSNIHELVDVIPMASALTATLRLALVRTSLHILWQISLARLSTLCMNRLSGALAVFDSKFEVSPSSSTP